MVTHLTLMKALNNNLDVTKYGQFPKEFHDNV